MERNFFAREVIILEMYRHRLCFRVLTILIRHLLTVLRDRASILISQKHRRLALWRRRLNWDWLRWNYCLLRYGNLDGRWHKYLNKVVQVVIVVPYGWLVIGTLPLAIDNKLKLVRTRTNLDGSLKQQLKFSVWNLLHGHLLPIGKRTCKTNILTTSVPVK
jgi:hypothetical protein